MWNVESGIIHVSPLLISQRSDIMNGGIFLRTFRKLLSVLLCACIMGGVFPLTVINANADDSLTDRTNVNMDYKYDKTLEQVQREARDEMTKLITNKDNGDIKWKHVSFLSGKTGDIREKLTCRYLEHKSKGRYIPLLLRG